MQSFWSNCALYNEVYLIGSSNASSEGVKETASMDTPPVQTQSQSLSQNVPPSKPMTIPSQLPSSRPHQVSTQEDDPPKSAGSSTSIEFGEMDTKNEQPQPTPFPQVYTYQLSILITNTCTHPPLIIESISLVTIVYLLSSLLHSRSVIVFQTFSSVFS